MEYKTIDDGVASFLQSTVKAAYGAFASFLRVPTFIRRIYCGQNILERIDPDKITLNKLLGGATGLAVGGLAALCLGGNAMMNSAEGEHMATTIGTIGIATNVASGLYELKRRKKTQEQRREVLEEDRRKDALDAVYGDFDIHSN